MIFVGYMVMYDIISISYLLFMSNLWPLIKVYIADILSSYWHSIDIGVKFLCYFNYTAILKQVLLKSKLLKCPLCNYPFKQMMFCFSGWMTVEEWNGRHIGRKCWWGVVCQLFEATMQLFTSYGHNNIFLVI